MKSYPRSLNKLKQHKTMLRKGATEPGWLGLRPSLCHVLAVCPWITRLTSLYFNYYPPSAMWQGFYLLMIEGLRFPKNLEGCLEHSKCSVFGNQNNEVTVRVNTDRTLETWHWSHVYDEDLILPRKILPSTHPVVWWKSIPRESIRANHIKLFCPRPMSESIANTWSLRPAPLGRPVK